MFAKSGPDEPGNDVIMNNDLTYAEATALLERLAGHWFLPPLEVPPPLGDAAPSKRFPVGSAPAPKASAPALSADTFSSLLEAVPDALVIVNAAGLMVLVNSQTEQLFGYRREELLGQPVELLVPERSRARHMADRAAYTAAPRVRPMSARSALYGRHKDGREIPVEINLSPLVTNEGLLVISAIRDIRERKKLEIRYRMLVEEIPAVTFLAALDEGANELYVSPQIETLLGFSQREWLENPVLWYTQLHPEDRERWHREFAHTCATGEPFRSIYRFLARDGRVVWVRGDAKLIRDEDGRPLFLQGIAFDITALKQAEEELKALNQTLEQRVAERTVMAEHRAHELERSNAALEQLGFVMAHDLRQPLRTIKSFTQKLAERQRGQLDPEADDYITRTVNAADRMRVLIDDLLIFSRVGTQGKKPAPTDCSAAVAAACANLHAALEEAGAQVIAEDLPLVLADATQLVQLFQNLINNALKFRAERPPRIHLSARPDGRFWEITVADNGIGIEPQYLQRIFGLGERLHSISQYPGNGIGLATCDKIVQRHGGRIWAASAGLDQGSTFSFTLPGVS